jgi:Zn-dependent membrane protease YugP
MFIWDWNYLLITAPALILAIWAQMRVQATYHEAQRMPAPLSGAGAARHVLDSAGLTDVAIEQVGGFLSDHYDPRAKVLRLSPQVYQSRTLAAVGIAAHEAGHALQDAEQYAPMTVRNAAVPLASFGSNAAFIIFFLGLMLQMTTLVWLAIILFGGVVFFQLVNLPVEFNASARAKQQLVSLGIIDSRQLAVVSKVLNAAAWTYVAATLQAVLTLLYFLLRASGSNRD